MAYQNVGVPRFYVNSLEWLASIGIEPFVSRTFYSDTNNQDEPLVSGSGYNSLNPSSTNIWHLEEVGGNYINFSSLQGLSYNFAFLLGHNISSMINAQPDLGGSPIFYSELSPGNNTIPLEDEGVNNGVSFNGMSTFTPDNDGWTLVFFNIVATPEDPPITISFLGAGTGLLNLNAVAIGKYYDMTNAPNLSLQVGYEYGGTKEFTTYNGSSISNTMWNKPPKWGSLGAWELAKYDETAHFKRLIESLSRSGRRTWDLKFSYIDDGDLWGSNQMLSKYGVGADAEVTDLNGDEFQFDLLSDDNFFSAVWHKTLGGTLPFIFQPDSSNMNPDQFAIARFVDGSLKAEQTAFNVYDISLKIEEVW